jgi:hypothetical protein
MADDRIVIYAKLLSGDIIPLRVSPIEPILSIKARLAKKSKDLDPVYMKLFDEAGDQLEDSEMIGNVLSNESTVNVFVDLDQERDVSRERSELKLYRKSMAEKLRR